MEKEKSIAKYVRDSKRNSLRITHFLTRDVWEIPIEKLPKWKAILLLQVRIVLLVARGFKDDKCYIKASALTFYTLLSIVPVVAMLFGIARGFGVEALMEKNLKEVLSGHEEVFVRIMEFSNSLLENTHSGVIVGVGILVLFWTVVKLFGNIEQSFNDIWGIQQGRSLGRKLTDYLSMMLICPVLLVLSTSMSVILNTQILTRINHIPFLSHFPFLKLVTFSMIWLLFTMLYMFLPNTRVRFKSGFAGGVIAGTIFLFTQWAYVTFQFFTAKYNAIYGSFAALPLFLFWLQLSWVIMLIGAEISYAVQNVKNYDVHPSQTILPFGLKKLIALLLTKVCVDTFQHGKPANTAEVIAYQIGVPARIVREVLFELVKTGILAKIHTDNVKEPSFQPARNIDELTVQFVLSRLESFGDSSIQYDETELSAKLRDCLSSMENAVSTSKLNVPLYAI
ncbi:MAG: YihY/virulence factor BrkB family protein [Candidatus Auribacterota bacterium]|nr:YihY/virulence factor BrkB family protein [Candidatus Auribacterota bacterium]